MYRFVLVAWTLSIAGAAPQVWAQPASGSAEADPQDAQASVPRLIYQSPLVNYRGLSEEQVASWKETNDKVGRIGGWRAYAREAQEPESPSDSAPATADTVAPAEAAKPMHGGHGGHKMH